MLTTKGICTSVATMLKAHNCIHISMYDVALRFPFTEIKILGQNDNDAVNKASSLKPWFAKVRMARLELQFSLQNPDLNLTKHH